MHLQSNQHKLQLIEYQLTGNTLFPLLAFNNQQNCT